MVSILILTREYCLTGCCREILDVPTALYLSMWDFMSCTRVQPRVLLNNVTSPLPHVSLKRPHVSVYFHNVGTRETISFRVREFRN